ncbi:MAG: CoB--CoM heterodisulfide reductase iron-sulfur subunit A family protein [Longimicrobiales bacterium]
MNGNGAGGKILVVGGGISGLTAAVEASEAGAEVVLVEKEAFLGGRVARSNQYFPKLCPPTCGLEINLRRVKTSPRIRILTQAEVTQIAGRPGAYRATIRKDPRYVRENCTACGDCVEVCPEERPDGFNLGMGTTKAVYLPFDMAYPFRYVIDGDACLGEAECGKCVPACPFDAIDLGMEAETEELEVQSVIWATGWDPPDASQFEGLGFGTHPDIITNVMMERLAAPSGPTEGEVRRPSNDEPIESVAFVQCAGSRDENHYPQCSGVCCLASLKQTRYVRERYPDAEIYVFYIDIRAPGRLEDFFVASKADEKLTLIKGKVARVTPSGDGLEVEAEDTLSGDRVRQTVDLVVLATGMIPTGVGETAVDGGLETDAFGFLVPEQSQAGILPVGCAKRPADVAMCNRDATAAALKALGFAGGADQAELEPVAAQAGEQSRG